MPLWPSRMLARRRRHRCSTRPGRHRRSSLRGSGGGSPRRTSASACPTPHSASLRSWPRWRLRTPTITHLRLIPPPLPLRRRALLHRHPRQRSGPWRPWKTHSRLARATMLRRDWGQRAPRLAVTGPTASPRQKRQRRHRQTRGHRQRRHRQTRGHRRRRHQRRRHQRRWQERGGFGHALSSGRRRRG